MAKSAKQDNDINEAAPTPPKGSGGAVKWIIVGMLALVIIGGAVAGGFYFFTKTEGIKKEQPAIGIPWIMEPFIVNLADHNGDRYLKIAMQFEVHNPALLHELDMVKPRIRDTIIDLLSSKSHTDLADSAGKQRLKGEIITRANTAITTGKIVEVYFTEFVIQ
ncbi:MAG: flagellar basal body-associated FliL family protein [Syntrophobacterales bacterium]|jgi:flagellar FliL protein|nr:flagellar basal body-associated FliL family protein [Syntrophobacterales bacterium]